MNNWKTSALTILAFLGAWSLYQRYGRGQSAKPSGDPVARERFVVGAKAQAEAAKAVELGGVKPLADANASAAVVKS